MDDIPFSMTDQEFKDFHRMDRLLYVRLVLTLNREPTESMQIMAFWLWLQQLGFPNIVQRMLSLTDQVVQVVAEEAVRCINSFTSSVLPVSTNINIPMTQNLLESPITVHLIHYNRNLAVPAISKTINEVYSRVFKDIIEEARARAANEEPVPPGNGSGGSNDDHDQPGTSASGAGNTTVSPSTGLSPSARRRRLN